MPTDKDAFQTFITTKVQHILRIATQHISPFHHTFWDVYMSYKALIAAQ